MDVLTDQIKHITQMSADEAGLATAKFIKENLFYLNCIHSAFAIHSVKKEFGKEAAQKRPLASFLLSFISCYLSGMCVNFFCGIPILSGLKSDNLNFAIVLLWWVINFVAPDLIDSIFKNKITLFILLCGKELLRCKKIYAAVDKGSASYDNHFLLTVVIGSMGACGGGFIKHAISLVKNNNFSSTDSSCSSVTKMTCLFSSIYAMEKFGMLGPFDVYIKNLNRSKLILIQFITMTIKVFSDKCGHELDPFKLPEKIISEIFIKMGRDLEIQVDDKKSKKKKNE